MSLCEWGAELGSDFFLKVENFIPVETVPYDTAIMVGKFFAELVLGIVFMQLNWEMQGDVK